MQENKETQETQPTQISNEPSKQTTNLAPEDIKPSKMAFAANRKVVVDANAIINGVKLEKFGNEFYTANSVVNEIRDSRAKQVLNSLPFKLITREPSSEAVSTVKNYSKRTGDYANLSKTDIDLIALTYMLEIEVNGMKNIKPLPQKIPISGFKKVPVVPYPNIRHTRTYMEKMKNNKTEDFDNEDSFDEEEPQNNEETINQTNSEEPNQEVKLEEKEEKPNEEQLNKTEPEEEKKEEKPNKEEQLDKTEDIRNVVLQPINKEEQEDSYDDEEEDDDDDSDGEWITPSNVKKFKEKEELQEWDDEGPSVGCITTDFAMQNVLMQMGLNVITAGGHRMKYIKRWVKRCSCCFTLEPDVRRVFCPHCGNDTLLRVSCEMDDEGNLKFYYNPRKKFNLKGTIYPIRKPTGGKNNRDAILREDMTPAFRFGKLGRRRGIPRKKKEQSEDLWENGFGSTVGSDFLPKKKSNNRRNDIPWYGVFNGYGRKNPNVPAKRKYKKKK